MGGVAVQGEPGTCGGGLAAARIECGKSLAGTRPMFKFVGRAQPKGQSSAGMSEEEMEFAVMTSSRSRVARRFVLRGEFWLVVPSGRSRVTRRFLLRAESSGWFRHWVVCARCVNLYSTESSGWSRHRVVRTRRALVGRDIRSFVRGAKIGCVSFAERGN